MTPTIESEIDDVLKLEPDLVALRVAERVVSRRTRAERDIWLADLIAAKVDLRRRSAARLIEERDIPRTVPPPLLGESVGVRMAHRAKEPLVVDLTDVETVVRNRAAEMELRLTAELLATPLDLGNGASTTWGAATLRELDMRYRFFLRNISGNADSAARLLVAIRTLEASGARSLQDEVRA